VISPTNQVQSDVGVSDVDGRTLLHSACLNLDHDTLRYLAAHPKVSAKVNDKDSGGNTPLHLALLEALTEMRRRGEAAKDAVENAAVIAGALIALGANLDDKNSDGQSCIDLAAELGLKL
jgi:ankyrin repeat protein